VCAVEGEGAEDAAAKGEDQVVEQGGAVLGV
jgi:hypothetical protein